MHRRRSSDRLVSRGEPHAEADLGQGPLEPQPTFRGLRAAVLVLHPHVPLDECLQSVATRQSMHSRERQGPRAVLDAVERLAHGYATECTRVRQDPAIAESQLRDYQARLAIGRPPALGARPTTPR